MSFGSPRPRPLLTLLAAAWGIATSLAWAFVPAYHDGRTLTEDEGIGIVVWLAAPVLLLLVIHIARLWVAMAAWILLAGFSFVTGFSIGLFYLPAVVLAGLGFVPSLKDHPTAG